MANALAEGAREAGADDDIKRVPELIFRIRKFVNATS
jgi:hypothetical protein